MKAIKKVTKKEFPAIYLELLNGIFNLTSSEKKVMEAILLKRQELIDGGMTGVLLEEYLFSTKCRKNLYETLGLSSNNFANYLNSLVKKGVIIDKDGEYTLIKQVIPDTKVEFEFKII